MRNWIVTLALLAVGCDRYTAPEACEDVADAAGEMAARCFPGDPTAYDTMHEAVLEVVDGDCDNVVDVRNVDELRDECIPWMREVECSIVTGPSFELDPSCQDQLLYR